VRFEGSVAIVTGAGRGIGRATALRLAGEGASVTINDVDQAEAAAVAKEIVDAGGRALVSVGSITDVPYVNRMVEETETEFGRVEVLVNNAGVTDSAMTLKMKASQWQHVIDVNLTGQFNCIQAVGPSFVARFHEDPSTRCAGRIVNVSSIAGLRGTIGQVNYGAAKAGMIGVTMSVAREWAPYHVTSNAVAFGVVETRMTETVRTDGRFRDALLKEIPFGRYAMPEEVARAIAFLASSDADYITGQTLNISGGLHIGF
jgi:3-oxoacyl-[acyl-carrier protein] reductase